MRAIFDAVDWGELWRLERESTRAGRTLAVGLYPVGPSTDSIDVYVERPPYELLCAHSDAWSCTVVNHGAEAVIPASKAREERDSSNGIRAELNAPERRLQRYQAVTDPNVARVLCEAMRFTESLPGDGERITLHVTSTVPEVGTLDAVDWKHQRLYSVWWNPANAELRDASWTEIIPNSTVGAWYPAQAIMRRGVPISITFGKEGRCDDVEWSSP